MNETGIDATVAIGATWVWWLVCVTVTTGTLYLDARFDYRYM